MAVSWRWASEGAARTCFAQKEFTSNREERGDLSLGGVEIVERECTRLRIIRILYSLLHDAPQEHLGQDGCGCQVPYVDQLFEEE